MRTVRACKRAGGDWQSRLLCVLCAAYCAEQTAIITTIEALRKESWQPSSCPMPQSRGDSCVQRDALALRRARRPLLGGHSGSGTAERRHRPRASIAARRLCWALRTAADGKSITTVACDAGAACWSADYKSEKIVYSGFVTARRAVRVWYRAGPVDGELSKTTKL